MADVTTCALWNAQVLCDGASLRTLGLISIFHHGVRRCGQRKLLRQRSYPSRYPQHQHSSDASRCAISSSSGFITDSFPGVDPLRPYVAYEAMHDSGEVDAQGNCHPGTRIAIQGIIKRWADDPHPNAFVSLMIAAAGAGKSAIMRTIAKVLEEEGKLLGGFFCFRSSKRRNDGNLVIATLAAQLVTRIPHLRPRVYKAYEDNQGMFTKAMDIQALKLVIEPLNSIDPVERPQWPHVVLLDGLDEINGLAVQQAIVKVLAYINDHLVSPLHFLVASRPEPPILHAFDEFLGGRWSQLELDDSLKPNDDIDMFYIDHFQKICDRNPHLPLGWPGVPVRRILVDKGSGKFIFASVVVGVVGDSSSTLSPQERLDLVLEVTRRDDLRPLERLDLLYVTVLHQIPEVTRPQVLHILSLILAAGNTLDGLRPTLSFLDALFCVPSGTTRHRLCHLHSILNIPANGNTVSPQHATLGDFVFDKARSERFGFHVDKTQLAEGTFRRIAEALQSNAEQMSGQ